jgi:hypothetical protein
MSGPPPMGWPGLPGGPPPGDRPFGWPGPGLPPGPVMPPGPGMALPPGMRPPGMFGFGPPRPGFPPAGFPHPQFGPDSASLQDKPNDEGKSKQDENSVPEQSEAQADETAGETKESQEEMENAVGETALEEPGPPAFGGPPGPGRGPSSHGPHPRPPMPIPGPRPGGAWTARMALPPVVRGPGPGGSGPDFMLGPRPFGHGMGPRPFGPPEPHGQHNYNGEEEFTENQEEGPEGFGMEEQMDEGEEEYAEFEGR